MYGAIRLSDLAFVCDANPDCNSLIGCGNISAQLSLGLEVWEIAGRGATAVVPFLSDKTSRRKREVFPKPRAIHRHATTRFGGRWYNPNIARDLDNTAGFARQLMIIGEQSGDED